jgi:anti-sigma factor RsiW
MSDADATRRLLRISCADALELMTDHLEGSLSEADAARMRDHLAGCQPCSLFLDQLRATIAVVHDAGSEQTFAVDPERLDSLVDLFRTERGD